MRKEVLALGVLTLTLAACGGGSDPGTEAVGETATETTETSTDEVAEAASQTPMQAPVSAPADPIRGQGGLEEKCLGYKDGTITEVMYTGSEGAL